MSLYNEIHIKARRMNTCQKDEGDDVLATEGGMYFNYPKVATKWCTLYLCINIAGH